MQYQMASFMLDQEQASKYNGHSGYMKCPASCVTADTAWLICKWMDHTGYSNGEWPASEVNSEKLREESERRWCALRSSFRSSFHLSPLAYKSHTGGRSNPHRKAASTARTTPASDSFYGPILFLRLNGKPVQPAPSHITGRFPSSLFLLSITDEPGPRPYLRSPVRVIPLSSGQSANTHTLSHTHTCSRTQGAL